MAFAAGTTDPASSDLGRLWAEVFGEITIDGQGTYQAPRAVISYRAGELPATVCAEAGTEELWRENARYCPGDGVIAYDEDWFRAVSDRFSYYAPVSILAHEWGHHIESVVGYSELDIQLELEADCLSGLYATASGLIPHNREPSPELDAIDVAVATWFDLGDEHYAANQWLEAGVHGSGQQRMMAFRTGATSNIDFLDPTPSMTGGIPWCYGYRDFIASSYTELGPYRLLNLPGRPGTWAGDVFSIPPEARTSVETSALTFAWIADLPIDGGATDAQLQELWRQGFPNLKALAPVPIETSAGAGTAAAWYYESAAPGSPSTVESGIFALVSPADALGGLLILVYRPQAAPLDAEAPENIAVLEEQVAALYQVLGRLCSPDESGEASASNLDVVCMTELQ
jgi:hypothetical protein